MVKGSFACCKVSSFSCIRKRLNVRADGLSAIILLFFAVAGSFWWLTLVLSLFEMLVLGLRKKIVRIVYYCSHAINWGIPAISVIIGELPRIFC